MKVVKVGIEIDAIPEKHYSDMLEAIENLVREYDATIDIGIGEEYEIEQEEE